LNRATASALNSGARRPHRQPPAPEQVIASAFDQAEARDLEHRREWIVLVDGARRRIAAR
jgi:hypothetical protein